MYAVNTVKCRDQYGVFTINISKQSPNLISKSYKYRWRIHLAKCGRNTEPPLPWFADTKVRLYIYYYLLPVK